jgi:hypothetical protein
MDGSESGPLQTKTGSGGPKIYGSYGTETPTGLQIRTPIKIKNWTRICIKVKIQKLQRLKIEP